MNHDTALFATALAALAFFGWIGWLIHREDR